MKLDRDYFMSVVKDKEARQMAKKAAAKAAAEKAALKKGKK